MEAIEDDFSVPEADPPPTLGAVLVREAAVEFSASSLSVVSCRTRHTVIVRSYFPIVTIYLRGIVTTYIHAHKQ